MHQHDDISHAAPTNWLMRGAIIALFTTLPIACGPTGYEADDDDETSATGYPGTTSCAGSTSCSCTCENYASGCSAYSTFYNLYVTCGDTCFLECSSECATGEAPSGECSTCIGGIPSGSEEYASFSSACEGDSDCLAYWNARESCTPDSPGGSTSSGSGGGEDECSSNSDCGSKYKCVAGRCEPAQCTSDVHCSGCNHCVNTYCVPCLEGPYGCTC
jgi:hypothetical protein